MIKSMTGYGKAQCESADKRITIEIKSLNSKQIDVNCRIANLYRSKEIEIRKIVTSMLERGKVDLSLYFENLGVASNTKINSSVVKGYFNQLKELSNELSITDDASLLQTAIRLPDATKIEKEELEEEEWNIVKEALVTAIEDLNNFREQEGEALRVDILSNITIIEELLPEVLPYEQVRVDNVRNRIIDNLEKLELKDRVDSGRLEQEMIFYMEKFDINEEKVRLINHCNYFRETIVQDGAMGKKLGFIAQEIGREVNTLGSKANHLEIQKIVVKMKDSLERIKEQMLNLI